MIKESQLKPIPNKNKKLHNDYNHNVLQKMATLIFTAWWSTVKVMLDLTFLG